MTDNSGTVELVLFTDWLCEFSKDKQLVSTTEQSDAYAVHSIMRYIDQTGILWEVAQTYTGRVVIRKGVTSETELTVEWTRWETLHHLVVAPKS